LPHNIIVSPQGFSTLVWPSGNDCAVPG